MSFTADELQALNDIFDRKLTFYQHEIERAFDQRLIAVQQESIRVLTDTLIEQQTGFNTSLLQKLMDQQLQMAQTMEAEVRERHQQYLSHFEEIVGHALAAQLIAVDELLNQRLVLQPFEGETLQSDEPSQFDAIEVQTELPWEDLMDVFGKALDERFEVLHTVTQDTLKRWEQDLSAQLHAIQNLLHGEFLQRQPQPYSGNLTDMHDVFQCIEQLERIIDSMQVTMTANHALISNRLYHHQQQPPERAHPSNAPGRTPISPTNNRESDPASLVKEHGEE
ncbi:MAG: hypothetical protein M3Z24_16240 [Chloroflexota bacterium]|nr:hypothetical protein [Chloroflexota bacterium]